ncbi:MAG: aspartate aminotransferase family protein [FCB group bacterium]|nr:aspartate aminotransferase family protein [FCB group bacterium]
MNRWIELETQHGSGAYGNWPFALTRGEGVYVWDSAGNKYLDFATGIGVAVLGHAHPVLTQAITDQTGTLITCHSGYFANDVRARFLAKLTGITPSDLDRVFLCNSGTEAVETALKLARAHTGRPGIVTMMRSFHGRTMGSLSATWKKPFRAPFEPLVPGFTHIPFGDTEALEKAVTEETAAVLLEPIQGEAGVYPASEEYLREARRICDANGALLIFDEVQTGIGRTGKWFACEHAGVAPDILCLAKALGGGIPIGATVSRSGIAFEKGQHGNTFGGNPLSCRAGLTIIEYIEEHDLLTNITRVGAYFMTGLEQLAQQKPSAIRDIRGKGLMIAIQLRGKVGPTLVKLRDAGILALAAGRMNLRFLPPYIVTEKEIDQVLNVLEEVLP